MTKFDYVCEFSHDIQNAIVNEAIENIDIKFMGTTKEEVTENVLNSKLCDLTDTLKDIHKYL